jgi:TRAP transporter TAXI family solute receptor
MASPLMPPPMTITCMGLASRFPAPAGPAVARRADAMLNGSIAGASRLSRGRPREEAMHCMQIWTILAALSLAGGAASAQTITVATTQPGSLTHSLGSAVAKIATEFAGIRTVVQPQGSSSLLPISARVSEFGFSNSFDVVAYTSGTGEYEGRPPQKNVRVVARIFPNLSPMYVRVDSPIRSVKDLKGKRIPAGFAAQKSLLQTYKMHLSNAGLSYADVTAVLTPNVVKSADDFIAGKVDSFTFGLGAGKLKEVAAAVGPLRALPMDPDPAAIRRAQASLPTSYMMVVKPHPAFPEVLQDLPMLVYDFTMQTHDQVADDVVYRVVKALHERHKEMVAIFPGLRRFDPKEMAIRYEGLEYHPGAIKFHKEIGQWPPKER